MDGIFVEPWIPPQHPDLVRLAMAEADAAGLSNLKAWPEQRQAGVGFGSLPTFLCWRGRTREAQHLVLVLPQELGALVPGARIPTHSSDWLIDLNLADLARPLAAHPDLGGRASVQVVQVLGRGLARVRTWGAPAPDLVGTVLSRLSGLEPWSLLD